MKGSSIIRLVEEHEKRREKGINLIASENVLSKRVRDVLSSDLAGRYHSDYYGGSKKAQEIVSKTEELAEELFGAKHVMVKPISGNICDLNVLFSFTEPYDKVAMIDFDDGGYPLGLEKFDRERLPLPTKEDSYEIDLEKTKEIYEGEIPPLTILGASYIPFPHPVKEISQMVDEACTPGKKDLCSVYDGSHVLGLIATGSFQSPLDEGADVLIGSTHKTFYGPQGGLILTDSDGCYDRLKEYQDIDLDTGIGLIDNPHVNRIAALGVAIEEIMDDEDYGDRVVSNAKALAKALDDLDVPMRFKEKGYTESHQIFLDMDWDESEEFCKRLEKEDIFIDISGRIGVAEVTHEGYEEDDMNEIAQSISEVYHS